MDDKFSYVLPYFTVVLLLHLPVTLSVSIGISYGRASQNNVGETAQPTDPLAISKFIATRTIFDRVMLDDPTNEVLESFKNTKLFINVMTNNQIISELKKPEFAVKWVKENVTPNPRVGRVLVGNNPIIKHQGDKFDIVAALCGLRKALDDNGHAAVQVTTAHSMDIMDVKLPPRAGRFRAPNDVHIVKPILQFLRETKSPFVISIYPYFEANSTNYQFCAFHGGNVITDNATHGVLKYTNMFEALLDSVRSAIDKLGFPDVDIVIGETGWPKKADPAQAQWSSPNVMNVIQHVTDGEVTPKMMDRKFEAYLATLFDEDGPTTAEKNLGLFKMDFSPFYDAGLLHRRPKRGNL